MIKAVSFSLFGTAPIYLQGALMNAEQYPKLFKDWTCVFYVEVESVPDRIVSGLMERGALVQQYTRAEFPNGMFPRFLVADDPTVERFIVRDCDSRPSQREKKAVDAWIESGTDCHALRDHPYHAVLMLGGMWGAKGGVLKDVERSIKMFRRSRQPYSRTTQYGADQEWLWENVWPKLQKSGLVHDSCLRGKFPLGVPFPPSDDSPERFVGEIFDETDQPEPNHWRQRLEFITRQAK